MKGKLIVIEGVDSSGKETQAKLLQQRLEGRQVECRKLSFPRYDNDSSALVKMYLAGEFGKDPNNINAYGASSFYAVDRYASYLEDWQEFYQGGGVVVCDRYTTSNMIHQGTKIDELSEREQFFSWLADFEYEKLGLPRPDLTIYLNMPHSVSVQLMKNRANKITGEQEKDIHEVNHDYMQKCYDMGQQCANFFGWITIDCTVFGALRTADEIAESVYSYVEKIL